MTGILLPHVGSGVILPSLAGTVMTAGLTGSPLSNGWLSDVLEGDYTVEIFSRIDCCLVPFYRQLNIGHPIREKEVAFGAFCRKVERQRQTLG